MQLAHKLRVLAQDGAFHVPRADHVVGHQEEFLSAGPAVPGDHAGQLWDGAGLRVVRQQEVEHRHEVALARAEAAMQVSGLAAAGLDRLLDEAQRVFKGIDQLRRYHVVAQRRVRVGHAFGQLEHKVALMHALRNVDQVF